jgi:hypothetical protein
MELWLNHKESDSDTDIEEVCAQSDKKLEHKPSTLTDEELLALRNKMVQQTFEKIRSRAKPNQAKHILKDLAAMHYSMRENIGQAKRCHELDNN